MAEAAILDALREAVKCPVCLNDLKISVTLGCGHNFCHSDIKESWAHQQDSFPYPVCRYQCREGLVTSKSQLGRMIDIDRMLQFRSKAESQGELPLCEKHNFMLTPFCEEDLELLCFHCFWPTEQEGHCVRPITEVASEHRARIYRCIKPLKRQVAGLMQWPGG